MDITRLICRVLLALAVLTLGTFSDTSCPCNDAATRSALWALYTATEGPSQWTSRWDQSLPVCQWSGISCINTTFQLSISLGANNLGGTLPDDLSLLPNVSTVNITSNRIGGPLPASLSIWGNGIDQFLAASNNFNGELPSAYDNWTSIRVFDVSNNSLAGSIPLTYSAWTAVQVFSVTMNQLTGTLPLELLNWTSLLTFDVSANSLSGTLLQGPSTNGELFWPRLTIFSAGNNFFRGTIPDAYANWSSLHQFSVPMNGLTGTIPQRFHQWALLQTFNVQSNALSGFLPSAFGQWSLLVHFAAGNNSLTGAIPGDWSQWTSLQVFGVGVNGLTGGLPLAFEQWTQLQIFDAGDNQLTGSIPPSYNKWLKLESFNVSFNALSGTLSPLLSSFGAMSTSGLVMFAVTSNQLSGPIPSTFARWTHLMYFMAGNNSLSGTLPHEFSAWVSVRSFRVSQNILQGALPATYETFTSLFSFQAGNNRITGSLPPEYGTGWTSINNCHLYSNSLSGTIPSSWGNMSTLDTLFLYANNLSGTLPPTFATLPRLSYISIAGNVHLGGTLPAEWGTRTLPFLMLWFQNTSLSGAIPLSWGSSMLIPFTSTLTLCGTRLCGPAPTTFVNAFPFGAVCLPDFLLHVEATPSNVLRYQSLVNPQPVNTVLLQTCPTTFTLAPPNNASSSTAAPVLPYHNRTSPAPVPQARLTTIVAGPLGGAVAAGVGVAASALGIYRSGGLSRVVRCGATSGNITTDIGDNDSDDGALEVVVDMAQGHLIAVAVCVAVVVAIVLTATMLASHTDDRTSSLSFPRSVRRTLMAYHLPGRLVVMAVTLGPPLWEFGLALLLLKTEIGLGVISAISGAALLILVSMVVTMFSWCNNFHARFEHHRNNFKLHSHGLPWSLWSTLSGVYEPARGGEWVDTDDRTSFVKCYGEVFEDFTGGRPWYIALQCVLALCVGVPAAVSDAAGVNPTTFGRDCGVVQIIAGIMNMAPFMMLVLLRPYRAASNFAMDAVTELFGFIGGALVLRVGASNDGDNGPVANAADVILTIQFWLAIALAILHVIHSAFLWYTRRGEVRGLCAGGQKDVRKHFSSFHPEALSSFPKTSAIQKQQLKMLLRIICNRNLREKAEKRKMHGKSNETIRSH